MKTFKEGQTVKCNDSGRVMTVHSTGDFTDKTGTGPKNGVLCTWFDANSTRQFKVFDVASLTAV